MGKGNTVLTTYVSSSREGYSLQVVEVPLWAHAVQEAYASLCCRLHHRLCDIAWPPGWRVGQTMLSVASRREVRRWTTPLTDDEVRRHFPESVLDLDD
jgi:hypothetical protein